MSESKPSDKSPASADPQLNRLYDYTKFHIGLYTTVLGGVVALFFSDALQGAARQFFPVLIIAAFCFAFAGLCGGVVAASTPEAKTYEEFMGTPIGPLGRPVGLPAAWMRAEHVSFWAGVVVMLGGLVYLATR